jgi:hypothetical protein
VNTLIKLDFFLHNHFTERRLAETMSISCSHFLRSQTAQPLFAQSSSVVLNPRLDDPVTILYASNMHGEIFDEEGRIRSLDPSYILTIPDREKVNKYGQIYTYELVRKAKNGDATFELFMELKRRAAWRHLKKPYDRFEWDDEIGYTNAHAMFLSNYDRKWGIILLDNLTYMQLR